MGKSLQRNATELLQCLKRLGNQKKNMFKQSET